MANSASDARSSEQELRRQLIESRAVDVMVAVGPNLFDTVTLPCTLWFFDKGKVARHSNVENRGPKNSTSECRATADTVLFIDARHIYRQVDRAHREWTPAQIGFLANLVRLYRGEALDFTLGGDEARAKIQEIFGVAQVSKPAVSPISKSAGRGKSGARSSGDPSAGLETGDTADSEVYATMAYRDVPGLCRAATLKEIEAQGWSLNPGRYVGVAAGEAVSDEDFKEQLSTLNEELETLNTAARKLETTIAGNVTEILAA